MVAALDNRKTWMEQFCTFCRPNLDSLRDRFLRLMEVGVPVIRHLKVPEDSRTEVTVNAAVGIDIGGTFIKIVAVSPEGAILYRSRISLDNSSVHPLANHIRGEIGRASC